ncbi:ribose 5-phosphate isomerase B [Dyadobacter tibetensis]|uniref:ribose 5-phosphate isomerase B n=1 Tax=Dyadobacter tibetensis TaxID=1211851 RepID=UPI00046EE7DA|nr:ribose 5-phosphate isomerase B [Dyadobacter tibetensis]
MRKIAIGSDHAGFPYKEPIINWLTSKGYQVNDYGTYSADSADYADFAHPVAAAVETGEYEKGILLCGSGQGVCITANKHQGIRASLVWDPEIAALSRQHNDANVICFPVRFIGLETALESLGLFLETSFEGGRHQKRVEKISC